ncbi:KAP family P-loop NTPase fold protein [Lonsdalea populi]|nr:P-loop NTPase fold protein [Lonsdalea populi]
MLDKPITDEEHDAFGFSHIATQLAKSIDKIGREGSAVFGIEGAWGSGKTSLLNLLRYELECCNNERTFLLTISPWLNGDSSSQVASLLLPVAKIIEDEEKKRLSPGRRSFFNKKTKVKQTAKLIFRYTQATARILQPVAQLAGAFPSVPNFGATLQAYSDTTVEGTCKTTEALKTEIGEKVKALDLNFIVLLDDLDRLEPVQVVEVTRLIKSVADFPRFRYILCYDKAIIVQAIKNSLNIEDGNAYLQKIVQISFSLPQPESFVLARHFLNGATKLYQSVNDCLPNSHLAAQLQSATDIFGTLLKTPREVQLALNGIQFRYSGIRDYVFMPDLCFLQLLRVTCCELHDWIEIYLTKWAIMESKDGYISNEERDFFLKNLKKLLTQVNYSPIFLIGIVERLPGIVGTELNSLDIFQPDSDSNWVKMQSTSHCRLKSMAYWRYYFAFSSPQNVFPPSYFDNLFLIAANEEDNSKLEEELLSKIDNNGISSRSWFEHILSQLTEPRIDSLTIEACTGLLRFFFNSGDEIYSRYRKMKNDFHNSDLATNVVGHRLLKKMFKGNREKSLDTLFLLTKDGVAWLWIASFISSLLLQNGLVGNRPAPESEKILSDADLIKVRNCIKDRLDKMNIDLSNLDEAVMKDFVWAWRYISGANSLESWIENTTEEDFLKILLNLRSRIFTSNLGLIKVLREEELYEFMGGNEKINSRLSKIKRSGDFPDLIQEVYESIELHHSYS